LVIESNCIKINSRCGVAAVPYNEYLPALFVHQKFCYFPAEHKIFLSEHFQFRANGSLLLFVGLNGLDSYRQNQICFPGYLFFRFAFGCNSN
jgi:hypothetical protein